MSKKLRFLSFVLALVMLISSTPVVPVYAQEEGTLSTQITNPFSSSVSFSVEGQTVNSNSFRIPAMVTLADGTIVAAADIRWNTTYDGGCLDTLVARSTDGGVTWSYSVANYLGDNGNDYNSQSTAFIDPSLTVAADGKTVYLLCDLYPYGIALNGNGSQKTPATDIGFTEEGYLKLSNSDHTSYDYYLKDGYIYDSSNTQVAGFTVDAHFNLYDEDGNKVSNLFFADSPYKVVRTGFLYLISSTDGGATWSAPTLLDLKNDTENVCLASPGSGITTANGIMVFPVYSYTTQTQKLGFICSSDNGATWQRSADFDSIWASESAVIEIGEGTLRFFFRNQTSALCYVDYDMNAKTWGSYVNTGVKTNSNTQLSAITYSKTFNGNQVVLVSCPTGPNEAGSSNSDGSYRTNGKIFVGVVAADGAMTWPGSVDVSPATTTGQLASFPYTEDQGFFAYSCLTERSDGSIAIMYENCQSGWGAGDDKYFTINTKAYSSDAFGVTFDSNKIVTREKDGVTVTGYIPGAIELQVSGVSGDKLSAVSNGLIDRSGFSEILSISGKNIMLLDGNSGTPWHPGAGRPVTVTVSDVWTPAGKVLPVVDVYHILDDAQAVEKAQSGGYLLTCTDPAVLTLYPQEAALLDGSAVPYVRLSSMDGSVVANQDGSVTFETDSFSDYFIVLGFTDGLSLSNNGNDTYYVEPGTTLTFNRSVTWAPQGTVPTGITASGNTITISNATAIPSEVTYKASWTTSSWFGSSASNTATVTIMVSTRDQIVSGALKDEKYPVILSVVRNTTKIPSEPGTTDGDYSMFNSDYSVSGWGYPEFSPSAEGIISPNISDVLIRAIDETNAIGYSDASGTTILPYLTGIDWNIILEKAADSGWSAIDGTSITDANKSNYKVIPYVVKLMNEPGRGTGWHIDCAIVRRESATLSYNVNLDNYTVNEEIKLPNAVSNIPVFNASVGSITGLTGGSTVRATYNGEQMTLTFKGWNTSPDGKGTMYTPGAEISIAEDTVLYAIWEGELVPGELYIYKTVTAEDGAAEPSGATYQFSIQFSTAGTYNYTVYNADGSTVFSGSLNTQGTINLANGQYAAFTGIPANTTYKVTENEGSYTTTFEGDSGVVRSGGRAVARFVNHYAYIEPEVTITYIAKDGGSVTLPSETVKVNNGSAQGSTAVPNDGYQFAGWFRDEACTQPVDPSWITSGNHLLPKKEGDSYQAATYYAKFESAVTSLTISKTGHIDIDENQSFLFRVEGEGVDLIVTVHRNGFTTINGLKVGSQYTVTELTDWSWRYADTPDWIFITDGNTAASGVTNGAEITLGSDGNKIAFTNTRDEEKWLDGDSWLDNLFKGN